MVQVQWTSYASLAKHAHLSLSTSFLDLKTGQSVQPKEVSPPEQSVPPRGPDKLSTPESYEITIPLLQIYSIRKVVPTLGSGTPYIIISTDKGVALPPLYFTTGGIKELFEALKVCVYVTKSTEDANVFFINDRANMLVKSMSSLESVSDAPRQPSARTSFLSDISLSILGAFSKVPKMGRKAIKCTRPS